MSKPTIIEKTPMNTSQFKKELDIIKERDGELTFRGNKTAEHIKNVKPLAYTKAESLLKKMQDLEIPRLKPEHMHKIIDVLPINEAHLKSVLSGYTITVQDENLKKIMDVVKEFLPKKK